MMNTFGTFSILAISKDCKLLGVAVASGSTAVGSRVPHAKPGVGVIATQAYTNVVYGVEGLKLLSDGLSPEDALKRLLANDCQKDLRQVAIMDFAGRKTVFTGNATPEKRGEIVGENFIVIGNFLRSEKVVECMAKAFAESNENFASRLMAALKAGSEKGGDMRGERSAAIIIVSLTKTELKLKIDESEYPVQKLSKIIEKRLS